MLFSPCANQGGETVSAKRKCAACSAQVLINTACLRAFCFCVLIGTNALESFNGSIAAMVPKRSDFFVSHVGRAQLALLKRCHPGGYAAVVDKLRARLQLPPLTPEARAATLKQQRKAGRIRKGCEVWSRADVAADGDAKLARRNKTSIVQANYHQKKLKVATAQMDCTPGARSEDRAGGGAATSRKGKGRGKKRRVLGDCSPSTTQAGAMPLRTRRLRRMNHREWW